MPISRIARAVHRVSAAFRADPQLELSRDDIQRLTELEPSETEVVIEALADAGVVVPDRSNVRARGADRGYERSRDRE